MFESHKSKLFFISITLILLIAMAKIGYHSYKNTFLYVATYSGIWSSIIGGIVTGSITFWAMCFIDNENKKRWEREKEAEYIYKYMLPELNDYLTHLTPAFKMRGVNKDEILFEISHRTKSPEDINTNILKGEEIIGGKAKLYVETYEELIKNNKYKIKIPSAYKCIYDFIKKARQQP